MNFNEILAKAIQEMNDAENAAKTDDTVDMMGSMLSVLVDISNTLNTMAATLRQWMEISR